jgi:cell wall-associated NlpC family hydrolase
LSVVTGVDCSGLINLAYRTVGMDIPRDAHEQFLRAKPVNALQPADTIFLSERGNPKRIVHVMLYAGEGEAIEGPGTGSVVRRIAVVERLGQPLDWLAPGAIIDGQTVFFGSFLP